MPTTTCISWTNENVWESVPARVNSSPGEQILVAQRVGQLGAGKRVHAEHHPGLLEGPEHLIVVAAARHHRWRQSSFGYWAFASIGRMSPTG